MPKTTRTGKAREDELPATLQRSDDKAKRTFAKAHDAAAKEDGEGPPVVGRLRSPAG